MKEFISLSIFNELFKKKKIRRIKMATKKEISMIGFDIVAYAGDARTDLIDALKAAKAGKLMKQKS